MPWPLSAWAGTINKDGRRRRQWLKDLRISGLKMDLGNSRKSQELKRNCKFYNRESTCKVRAKTRLPLCAIAITSDALGHDQ